ncbi:uncharacterized protein [Aegilops tauschii subsp. strangulata]|uniref:uncharacterized protein n=1 Tax=Aegilops tauschii subsp. strangulata TaxID=200361 RepID=UPI001E1CA83F|nr:polycystic kidney disease protein 1-like 3 [Aegilops tauschii subsp. strangulata]XP_045087059.1 polycystic kidney disease protein 1-like 3 [Aegilops tauschii subsp. strangulata]
MLLLRPCALARPSSRASNLDPATMSSPGLSRARCSSSSARASHAPHAVVVLRPRPPPRPDHRRLVSLQTCCCAASHLAQEQMSAAPLFPRARPRGSSSAPRRPPLNQQMSAVALSLVPPPSRGFLCLSSILSLLCTGAPRAMEATAGSTSSSAAPGSPLPVELLEPCPEQPSRRSRRGPAPFVVVSVRSGGSLHPGLVPGSRSPRRPTGDQQVPAAAVVPCFCLARSSLYVRGMSASPALTLSSSPPSLVAGTSRPSSSAPLPRRHPARRSPVAATPVFCIAMACCFLLLPLLVMNSSGSLVPSVDRASSASAARPSRKPRGPAPHHRAGP